MKFILLLICLFALEFVSAQKKGTPRHTSLRTSAKRPITVLERSYGTPTSITQIIDVPENNPAYETLKNLIENYNVPITFSDNMFHGKEALKRGDFIISLNGAFNAVKKASIDAGIDTSLVNTYDRNRSYITTVKDIKNLPSSSIYYEPAQSLIEKWGVAAPFTKSKMLNANSTVSETEAYDILMVTLGYHSAGINKLNEAISRDKFATILNNAVAQEVSLINSLHSVKQALLDAERRRQQDSINTAEIIRKKAIAKEIEAQKAEAQRKEVEARAKLKSKNN